MGTRDEAHHSGWPHALERRLFLQDFTDKQISTQSVVGGQLGTVISNASGAKVHGLELDARWSIDDNWSLVGGYTWLKTEYTDYKVLSGGSPDFARIGNCNLVTVADESLCEVDRTGNELERSPRHSAQFTLAYQAPSTLRAGWTGSALSVGFTRANGSLKTSTTRL